MGSGPLVTVIITNFNGERYVRAAVDSALAQTYPRTEVVVVDDGSTDGSPEILAAYGDRIVLLRKQNGGLASAINAGVRASRGDLIAWLDYDDVFLPAKLERVVQAHRARPRAVLVYHRLRTIGPEGEPRGAPWPHDVWSGDIRERAVRSGGFWPRPTTSAMTYSRAFLDKVLPMRESSKHGSATWPDAYAGDLAPFFGELAGVPEVLTYYRVHGKNEHLRPDADIQLKQVEFEVEQQKEALQRFGRDASLLPIDRNVMYMMTAHGLRPEVSLPKVLGRIMACPTLSPTAKLIEATVVLRRAAARLTSPSTSRAAAEGP